MADLTDTFSLRTAAADADDALLLLASCDEIAEDHTCLFLIENDAIVDKRIVPWQSSGIVNLGPKHFLVFGDDGHYLLYDAGQLRQGFLWNETEGPHKHGVMRAGCANGEQVCWVGLDRRGAVRNRQGRWTQMSEGLAGDYEGAVAMPDGSFLAYGWHGLVARTEGARWTAIAMPTNVIVTNGCVCPDGRAVLVGQNGVVLRGGGDSWEVLVADETNQDFWGVAWFEGKLHLSTMQFIYQVTDDDALALVQFTDGLPETYCHLIAGAKQLWSIGNKSLVARLGGVWRNVVVPNPK
jgi:hypothetical protein